jgi:hypothetical protein
MKKIVIVTKCYQCPHLGYGFDETPHCGQTLKELSIIIDIPEWCPLDNYKEKEDE